MRRNDREAGATPARRLSHGAAAPSKQLQSGGEVRGFGEQQDPLADVERNSPHDDGSDKAEDDGDGRKDNPSGPEKCDELADETESDDRLSGQTDHGPG